MMQRRRILLVLAGAGSVLLLAACTQLAALTLTPAGPTDVEVDGTIDFEASPAPDGVVWDVDGIEGGNATLGTISADGTYTAPARIPSDDAVEVTATDAVRATRTASATVGITATGTMYVLNTTVYVYGGMDAVDGNVAPDRSFSLSGVSGDFYDMDISTATDQGFLSAQTTSPMIFRVPSISTANGTITTFATLDDNGWSDPSGVVFDASRDILYVRLIGGLLVFDNATTISSGSAANRILTGANVGKYANDFDVRLTLDEDADRLFLSHPDGSVAVYDNASTTGGNVAPDREFSIDDASQGFLWGAAYDAARDELYLADQTADRIFVMDGASSATGATVPSRVIGGATNPLSAPSMVSYDPRNDRISVVTTSTPEGFAVFDDASTVNGDVAPDRLVSGASLPVSYSYSGHLDSTQ